MIKRITILTIVLLWLLAITGCSLLPQNSRSQTMVQLGPTPTPIPTPIVPTKPIYEVQVGEVVEKIKFSGRVAPVQEVELFFRTDGWIRNVFVERDDFVEKGQILADLEIEDLEKELASKFLELERAQSTLAEAERNLANEIRRAEVEHQIAQIKLESAQSQDLTPRQEQAAADLEKIQINLQQAQEAYDEIAWRNDRTSRQEAAELQQVTLDYIQARAAYELAVQDIENQKYDIAILDRELELAQIRLDELGAGVDPLLKNDVERAMLDVDKLKAEIADAQIIAPFDGQILSETLTEGREATARKTVAIIADLSELEISADPSSTQLTDLAEGMPVVATLSRRPGEEWHGVIRRLPYPYGGGGRSEGAEEDEDTSTRIQLEDVTFEDLDLEVGDLMTLEVILEQKDNVLWLPPQAVRTFEGRKFVVIQDGEIQRRVDVKVGIESQDRVEIEEGVTEGQIVVGP
ncbi:MAG: efflux RND transporter periplasmic adaptor subunit [Anaerolineae bacterium]|nr:efflux RND transporter periplasmic adaptor subunit [Anaerolineae bacterium]